MTSTVSSTSSGDATSASIKSAYTTSSYGGVIVTRSNGSVSPKLSGLSSTSKTDACTARPRSLRPSASRFSRMVSVHFGEKSTCTAVPTPRERHSMPTVPAPAKRSSADAESRSTPVGYSIEKRASRTRDIIGRRKTSGVRSLRPRQSPANARARVREHARRRARGLAARTAGDAEALDLVLLLGLALLERLLAAAGLRGTLRGVIDEDMSGARRDDAPGAERGLCSSAGSRCPAAPPQCRLSCSCAARLLLTAPRAARWTSGASAAASSR